MKQAKKVCRELLVGLTGWVLLTGVILAIVIQNHLAAIAGSVFGGGVAAGVVFHMYRHLDIALDMDAAHAQRHIQISAAKRMLFMGVALVVSFMLSTYIDPLSVIVSLFGVKVAALANPFVHRILSRKMQTKQ